MKISPHIYIFLNTEMKKINHALNTNYRGAIIKTVFFLSTAMGKKIKKMSYKIK